MGHPVVRGLANKSLKHDFEDLLGDIFPHSSPQQKYYVHQTDIVSYYFILAC